MQPPEEVPEQAVAIAFVAGRASSEGAAKRRGNPGLVGHVLDTDDASIHVLPGRRLLSVSSAGHG